MKKLLAASTLALVILVAPAAGVAGAADTAPPKDAETRAAIDKVLRTVDQKIDDAVTDGHLDQDRAARIKDRLERGVTRLADGQLGPRAQRRLARVKGRHHLRQNLRRGAIVIAAKTIDIDRQELTAALRDGQSVADVARANDVDPQQVIDAIVAAATTKIDGLVANDKIDESRAATIKERLPERVTKAVNATRGERAGK